MTRWLRRRRLVDERPIEERSNEAAELSPLEACMQLSLFGGTFLRLAADGTPVPVDDARFRTGTKSPWAAETSGFPLCQRSCPVPSPRDEATEGTDRRGPSEVRACPSTARPSRPTSSRS